METCCYKLYIKKTKCFKKHFCVQAVKVFCLHICPFFYTTTQKMMH